MNNIDAIVLSYSFDPRVANPPIPQSQVPNDNMVYTFVALFSVSNTLGRLAFGALSDVFAGRFPRPFWLLVCTVLMLLTCVSLCLSDLYGLFFLVLVLGACYGGLFGLMPSLIADRFGQKNFGINYGLAAIAPAVGSLLFSTAIAGGLADHFAQFHSVSVVAPDGASEQCIGHECYLYTFLIFSCSLLISTGACLVLWYRATRYNSSYQATSVSVNTFGGGGAQ